MTADDYSCSSTDSFSAHDLNLGGTNADAYTNTDATFRVEFYFWLMSHVFYSKGFRVHLSLTSLNGEGFVIVFTIFIFQLLHLLLGMAHTQTCL